MLMIGVASGPSHVQSLGALRVHVAGTSKWSAQPEMKHPRRRSAAFGVASIACAAAAKGIRSNCRHSDRVASSSSTVLEIRDSDRAAASFEAMLGFERKGFSRCPCLISEAEVLHLRALIERACNNTASHFAALKHQVRVHHGVKVAAACRTARDCMARLRPLERTGDVGFLQYFNLHRKSAALRRAALSPRFGFWAAQLLGTSRVRLYQDALFLKRPGDGTTTWHSDLSLSPFDTNAFLTMWIALTPIPAFGGSGLTFAIGSHRDFALPFHGDPDADLDGRYEVTEGGELRPGDATVHHGWTLHSAGGVPPNASSPRMAWALSFVADGVRLLRKRPDCEQEDAMSYEPWIGDIPIGAVVDHPLVPLLPSVS